MTGRLLQMLRIRTAVRVFAIRALDAHALPPLLPDGSAGGARTLEVGLDPLRILLLGSGSLLGYGVPSRQRGIDGTLARLLAEATGRGVIVENRTVKHLPVARTVDSLGASGTHTFHLAIWSPGFLELTRRTRTRSWRRATATLLEEYRATSSTPLVILDYATALGRNPLIAMMRTVIAGADRGIAEAAAARDVPVVSPAPQPVREIGVTMFDEDTARGIAERLAPVALAAMGLRVAEPVRG